MTWAKQYHTEIVIEAAPADVWRTLTDFAAWPEWNPLVRWFRGDPAVDRRARVFIIPLGREFEVTVQTFREADELTWMGTQLASWFLAGEHYYRLEKVGESATRLMHGECFRGLGAGFIPRSFLSRMEAAFTRHNVLLKSRVESG